MKTLIKHCKWYAGVLFMLILGLEQLQAAEEIVYTLDCPKNTSNSSYTSNYDVTVNDLKWKAPGNQYADGAWRIGGKNTSNTDRTVYTQAAIGDDISKIVITHGAKSSGCTVVSMTVKVSTAKNAGGTVKNTFTPNFVNSGTVTITRPDGADWSNCYYTIIYEYKSSSSSNNYLILSKIDFYKVASPCTSLTMSSVTATAGDKKIDLSWPVVSNASSYTVTCKNKSTGVAAGTIGAVSGSGPKTCSITGLTNGTAYTWSVEPVGDGTTYCTSNTPATGDATPNVSYTITYHDKDGSHTTTVTSGSNIKDALNALYGASGPTSCDATNYPYFYGWKVGTISGSTTSAPTILSTETASANAEYYAVWTDTDPSAGSGWEQVTSLSVGDEVVFTFSNNNVDKEMTGMNASNYGTASDVSDFPDDIAGTYPLTIEAGNGGTGYSFKNGSNYLSWSSGNSLTTSTTKDDASSWTISESTSGNFKFANVGTTTRILQFNNNSSSYRWACYTSSQSAFQIYKQSGGGGTANYITTCCQNLGTINGSFTLNKANGSYDNCDANFVVTVSGITPNSGYELDEVTATGGNNVAVAGPDGSGNYTVTYTKGNTITSTINVSFVASGGGGGGGSCDVLDANFTGEPSSYTEWSNKSGSSSSAVYAGQSAGGSSYIQLRSNNNNSGIVTTTSGGIAESVSVTWNSSTESDRTLNVYGKNSAYSAATDLYSSDASTQGTLLGTIVKGTSTTLNITGSYEYIGLRSASGAMYLDEVQVCWASCDDPATALSVGASSTSINTGANSTITASGGNGGTISWEITSANAAYGTLTGSGATSRTFSATKDGTYTIKVSQAKEDDYCAQSATVDVTVNCALSITSDAAPQTQSVTQGDSPTNLSVTASGSGTLSYQWYSNTSNSSSGWSSISGANSRTYTPPTTSTGTLWYYCRVTDSHCSTPVDSRNVSVTVNAAACTSAPTVSAGSYSSLKSSSVTVACSSGITSLGTGGCSITSYGFVYGTSTNPTTSNTVAQVGTTYTTTGTSFNKSITGLTPNTTYYVRPYATNGYGTDYGTQTLFTTPAATLYTVTFNAGSGSCATASLTETVEDGGVVLPSASTPCSGWSFAGWKVGSAQSETTTDISASLLSAGSNYKPTSNVTLYAVYAQYTSGSNTTFQVVNNTNTISAGYYVISYNRASAAYGAINAMGCDEVIINDLTGRKGVGVKGVTATSVASSATLTSKDPIWQFIASGNYWQIKNYKTNKYLTATTTANELVMLDSPNGDYSLWTITTSSDNNANTNTLLNKGSSTFYLRKLDADTYAANAVSNADKTMYFYWVSTAPVFGGATYNSNPSCPTHQVTIGSHTNGTIEVNGTTDSPQTVEDASVVTIDATPSSGYTFSGWTITKTTGGQDVTSTLLGANSSTASTSFEMPAYDVTVSATFAEIVYYTVKWSVDGDDSYSAGSPSSRVEAGTKWNELTLPTAPDDNTLSACERTKFVGWTNTGSMTGDGNSVPADLFKTAAEAGSTAINANTTFYAVFAKGSGEGWEKVTSAPDDWCGDYLLAYEASSSSVYVWNGSTDASNYVTATPDDGIISKPSGAIEITIQHFNLTDYYTIKVKEGTNKDKFFKGNSSNGFTLEDTQQNTSIGSVDEVGFTFTNSTSYLRFNTTSGQERFRFFKLSTAKLTAYKTIALYHEVSNLSDYVTECCSLKPATGLSVSSVTGNSVTLSWTAPSPTTGITKLQVVNADNGTVVKDGLSNTATSATISGLTECTTYNFKVVSYSASCTTSSSTVAAQPYSGAKTVTFNYNGGSGSPASFTTSCSGNTTTLPTPDARDGYTFLGWWSGQNGGNSIGAAGASYTCSGNTTIWAHWAQNFTVTYDLDGGAADPACAGGTYYVGQTVTVCSTTPTKLGYTFGGWKRSDNNAVVAAGNTFTMPSANVTLTAQWSENRHTVTYSIPTGGGDDISSTTVLDGHTIGSMPNITNKSSDYWCWTFLGWTTDAPIASGANAGKYSSQPDITEAGHESPAITGNTTFYAVYSRSGSGASGTVTLTSEIINSLYTGSLESIDNNGALVYGTERSYTVDGYTWTTTARQAWVNKDNKTCEYLQFNDENTTYLKLPTLPGDISGITISCKNASGNALASGSVYLRSLNTNVSNIATGTISSSSCTFGDLSDKEINTGYLVAAQNMRIIGMTISYGPPTTYAHTLSECGCQVTEFDLTYDANVSNYAGSTISCTNVTGWNFDDDGDYTFCAAPTLSGYKFKYWSANANGSGDNHWNAGETVSCLPYTQLTVYAIYERVYTVTFNNEGTVTPVTQSSAGASVAVPSATSACDATWAFVGWSTEEITPKSLLPSIEITSGTSTYTPTSDITLYAIYRKTSTSDAFVAGMSGAYKIMATYNSTDYYAQACNNNKLNETTTVGSGAIFYISYVAADGGKYTIQQANGQYLKYAGSSTSLELSDDAAYWTFSPNSGTWSVFAVGSGDRYLRYSNGTGFKTYNYSVSADYLSFVAAEGQYYYRTMSCATEYDITFHANGTTINWASGYPEASYKDLANSTVVSTFPTATFSGWTFIGWRAADYEESTTPPTASGVYGGLDGTSGNSLTISSADVDLYPVFTKFDDNEPFDYINGGDYYIYYLDASDLDTYGAAQRVYAGTYNDQKRYNSTALCAGATTFTFTKLANGNWTIFDNTTKKYLYGVEDDDLKQQNSASGAEWTITVYSGNQFNAFHVGTSYGQLIAQGDGRSATFMNYRRTNISNNPGLYRRVFLGSCTNRVYTTNPSTTPKVEIHGTVKVTSTNGQLVKAPTVLSVTGSNLSTSTITVASSSADFLLSTSTNSGSFAQSITINVNSTTHAVAPTTVYVAYNPSETSDGINNTVTVTVSDNPTTPTAQASTTAGDIQGRHLPAYFAIVTKVGETWYALPSDKPLESVDKAGMAVEVDNATTPTSVTLAPTGARWDLKKTYDSNGAANDRWSANGEKVRFSSKTTAQNDKGLRASVSGAGIFLDATTGSSQDGTTAWQYYEWILTTSDLALYNPINNNQRSTALSVNSHLNWGIHSQLVETKEIRLLPIEAEYNPVDVQILEWKSDGFVMVFNNTISATTVDVTTTAGTQSTTLASNVSGYASVAYNIAVKNNTLAADACKSVKIVFKNSGGTEVGRAYVQVPVIITSSTTNASKGFCSTCDVVVRDGATLTASSNAKADRYVHNMHVYPNSKLTVDATAFDGTTDAKKFYARGDMVLRAGRLEGSTYQFEYPQLVVNGSLNSTAVIYEYLLSGKQSYSIALPYSTTVADMYYIPEGIWKNSTAGVAASATNDKVPAARRRIQSYDGATRASGDQVSGWVKYYTGETLDAGVGYIIAVLAPQNWNYAYVRMPMTITMPEAATKTVTVAPHPSAKVNNAGWNLIGQPYLANFGKGAGGALSDTELSEGVTIGELVKDMSGAGGTWTGNWNQVGDVRYVTIPANDGKSYTQEKVTETLLPAFKNFFVQVGTGTTSLSFSRSHRAQSIRAYYTAPKQEKEVEVGLILEGDNNSDKMGILLRDDLTEEYDMNADLEKWINDGLNIYGLINSNRLAWVGVNEQIASGIIPLGYVADKAGEYVFTYDFRYYSDRVEAVYLTDYQEGTITNLVTSDYDFYTEAGTNNERFAITVQLRAPQIYTDVDIEHESGALDNLHVYGEEGQLTLVGLPDDAGVYVYDMTGKLISSRQTAATGDGCEPMSRMHISVPHGVYNVRVISSEGNATVKTIVR